MGIKKSIIFAFLIHTHKVYETNWKIYPNPFHNSSTLEFDNKSNEKYTLKIYDIQAKIQRVITGIDTDELSIIRQNLKPCLYFFQLLTKQKVTASGKLMVE